ncbi:MAG: mandelate racemase, partial [Verrucomicrobia bacterium]|nr:mandelate racemase [Verrucomicrobiota bacterium]
FHQLDLLDGVAMKVPRCGGLTEARRILNYMEQHGLLFFASGLTDPDVSLAATLLLYGAFNLERPAALNGPQFLSGTFLEQPVRVEGDRASVPSGFGLGIEVNETRLRSSEIAE